MATIWTMKCECGNQDIATENPPRERRCGCGRWNKYEEQHCDDPPGQPAVVADEQREKREEQLAESVMRCVKQAIVLGRMIERAEIDQLGARLEASHIASEICSHVGGVIS